MLSAGHPELEEEGVEGSVVLQSLKERAWNVQKEQIYFEGWVFAWPMAMMSKTFDT